VKGNDSVAAAAVPAEPADSTRLWTRPFLQVCTGGFLSYASQTPINPLIALWVLHLGGSATTVGLATAAFNAPSFMVRPLVGRLCDMWSARGVFAIGCLISGAGSLVILIPNLAAVFVAQALNGVGWGGINTGGYTLVAEIAPASRRGAASSYYQMARNSLGFYLPYVAIKLKALAGFWLPFLLTSVAGLLAAPMVVGIPERRKTKDPAADSADAAVRESFFDKFFERGSRLASAILFFSTFSGPAASTFVVLYAKRLGINEGAIAQLFLVRGAFSIATQSLLAGISDRIGRGPAVMIGLTTTASSMILLSQAHSLLFLMLGMIISTSAGALTPPALQAMAIDRAPPERRGAAMATYTLSFTFGGFFGGLLGGFLIDLIGYRSFYFLAAIPACVGLTLLFTHWKSVSGKAALETTS
jgi:MFS family permease